MLSPVIMQTFYKILLDNHTNCFSKWMGYPQQKCPTP